MLMRCCGSSSVGNSYALISGSGEILAVEAGVKKVVITKADCLGNSGSGTVVC